MKAPDSRPSSGAVPDASHGRHAAARPAGKLARVSRRVPTFQELLLREQRFRYRVIDRVRMRWRRRGGGLVSTAFWCLVLAGAVGVLVGVILPSRPT